MHREQLAARIGSRYVRNAMVVGMGCAGSMLGWMSGGTGGLLRMLMDWPIQAAICVTVAPLSGSLVGAWAGKKILVHRWSPWLLCPAVGFVCVWITTFLFSVVAYGEEGPHGAFPEDAVHDYIIKPLVLVTMFGGVFVVLVGLVLAGFLHRARRRWFTEAFGPVDQGQVPEA